MKTEIQVVYNREGRKEFSITEIYVDETGFKQGRVIETLHIGWKDFEEYFTNRYSMNEKHISNNGRIKISGMRIVMWGVEAEEIEKIRDGKESLIRRLKCSKIENCNGCMGCE